MRPEDGRGGCVIFSCSVCRVSDVKKGKNQFIRDIHACPNVYFVL